MTAATQDTITIKLERAFDPVVASCHAANVATWRPASCRAWWPPWVAVSWLS
ncbi:hypothetical protein ACFZAB_33595 [Streptomyces albogriseolus]|uniref:hypothetical protein n=1 Tax=Streptomyces albogriseolus TaxID=1887 RepID=UPI002258A11C|nr:hypothetical protein [Streptomyces viridodiastaticus]MCX4618058.1 hypothetical protein [Streptomyces viridodiastaticus]